MIESIKELVKTDPEDAKRQTLDGLAEHIHLHKAHTESEGRIAVYVASPGISRELGEAVFEVYRELEGTEKEKQEIAELSEYWDQHYPEIRAVLYSKKDVFLGE